MERINDSISSKKINMIVSEIKKAVIGKDETIIKVFSLFWLKDIYL